MSGKDGTLFVTNLATFSKAWFTLGRPPARCLQRGGVGLKRWYTYNDEHARVSLARDEPFPPASRPEDDDVDADDFGGAAWSSAPRSLVPVLIGEERSVVEDDTQRCTAEGPPFVWARIVRLYTALTRLAIDFSPRGSVFIRSRKLSHGE